MFFEPFRSTSPVSALIFPTSKRSGKFFSGEYIFRIGPPPHCGQSLAWAELRKQHEAKARVRTVLLIAGISKDDTRLDRDAFPFLSRELGRSGIQPSRLNCKHVVIFSPHKPLL